MSVSKNSRAVDPQEPVFVAQEQVLGCRSGIGKMSNRTAVGGKLKKIVQVRAKRLWMAVWACLRWAVNSRKMGRKTAKRFLYYFWVIALWFWGTDVRAARASAAALWSVTRLTVTVEGC